MDHIIEQAATEIVAGRVILYPTETVWGLGCDATNSEAVQKIYTIKQRTESKALIVLLADFAQLSHYVAAIPPYLQEKIAETDRPTTIVYPNAQNLAPNIIAADGSIAIRITQHPFCKALIQTIQQPLVSTSANISGQFSSANFDDLDDQVKAAVAYTAHPQLTKQEGDNRPSRIVRYNGGGVWEVLRP